MLSRMTNHNSENDARERESARSQFSAGLATPREGYKRPFDLSILVVSHVLFSPLWVALWIGIALVIWLDDKGPVLYGQIRVGKDGAPRAVYLYHVSDNEWTMAEYEALVHRVTMWNVAVERQIRVKGPDAEAFSNLVLTRDASKIEPMAAKYCILCNEAGGILRFEITGVLDVEDDGASEGPGKVAESFHHSFAGSEALHGQDHDRGEPGFGEGQGLGHHGAVGRAHGRDDQGLLACRSGNNLEETTVLVRSYVIEVGIAAIEEGADPTLFDVLDDLPILIDRNGIVVLAGERGHGNHGGTEEIGSDGAGSHGAWRTGR